MWLPLRLNDDATFKKEEPTNLKLGNFSWPRTHLLVLEKVCETPSTSTETIEVVLSTNYYFEAKIKLLRKFGQCP
jgi:hypothetical protein